MFRECLRYLFPNYGHDPGSQVNLLCSLWDLIELLPGLVAVFGDVSWFSVIEAFVVVVLSDNRVYLHGA